MSNIENIRNFNIEEIENIKNNTLLLRAIDNNDYIKY